MMFLNTKHGHARRHGKTTVEYRAWEAMLARCSATSGPDQKTYPARGIFVCKRWQISFAAFLKDMGPKPSPKHSLGRINNNKGYTPSNCRWETPDQQQQNTRTSKRWTILGLRFDSCRQAGRHFNVDQSTIRYWVSTGKDGCSAENRY